MCEALPGTESALANDVRFAALCPCLYSCKRLGDVASGLLDGRRATPLQPIPAPLPPSTRTEELRSFLFFTVVMAPLLAVIGVGGFGFVVWMYQLVAGPPAG